MKSLTPTNVLRRVVAAALLAMTVTLATGAAWAGPFRELGYDVGSIMVGNSTVATGDSIGVLYTNPALLSRFPETMYAQVIFWQPSLHIKLMPKPVGSDVPVTIYMSKMGTADNQQDLALPTVALKNKRRNTKIDDQYAYLLLGGTMSLGIKGLRVGNMMLIPIDAYHLASTKAYFSTENEQYFTNQVHFSNFGEWGKMVDGLLGVSYAPWDFLSFGASVRIGVTTVAKVQAFVPDASVQDYAIISNAAEIELALKPIVGIQAKPTEYLSLGLTWRFWSYMDLSGTSEMNLWQFNETSSTYTVPKVANQAFSMALDYEPMELSGGVGFTMANFTTQVAVTWNMWHFYKDSQNKTPQQQAHFPDSAYNEDPMIGKTDRFKWHDTVSVNWGGQYDHVFNDNLKGKLGVGFGYRPSPVPAQTGRTNYADTDTIMASLGGSLTFKLFEKTFGVDLGLQYWHLLERTVYKNPDWVVDEFADAATTIIGNQTIPEAQGLQTNNPGFPGYTISGNILVASLSLRFEF